MTKNINNLPPVYAASYDHIGIILWGEDKLSESIDRILDWLERHSDFHIGIDPEAFTIDYLAEYAPDLLARIKNALQEYQGRLGLSSCTYGQPLSMFINEESNIRQLSLAIQTTQDHLDYPISIYMVSEHAFHAQMPQLLAGCGFRGAILRTHFMMYGHNPEYDEPVGWWVGVDGSRLPTLPTYRGQAATPPLINHTLPGNTSTLDNRIITDGASERVPLTLADFRATFGDKIQPLIATRADDVRSLEALIDTHENDDGYQWVLLEDIFDIVSQPRAEFRTQPNDFKVRMPWGYCGSWIWRHTRQAEVAVLTAERLDAIVYALTGNSEEKKLTQAWKNLLVGQHHDIHICGLEDEARKYLGNSISSSQAIIQDALTVIAKRIGDDNQGQRTVVFNPLAWERTEVIDTANGKQAVTVPSLGFVAVPAKTSERSASVPFNWNETTQNLETPHYVIQWAKRGGFESVRSKTSGKIVMGLPKSSGTLVGLIDKQWCESIGQVMHVDINHAQATVTESGEIGGILYTHTWTFYAHTTRIDWHAEIEFGGQLIGRPKHAEEGPFPTDITADQLSRVPAFNDHEYKLRLRMFPYLSPYATGIRDYPFGIAETEDRIVQGIYWTAVSDGQVGLALFNRGLMGSLREPDGALSSILAFSLPYVWGTRVLNDTYTFELGILPFEGDWQNADLHRQALEYNYQPITIDVDEIEDSLGTIWTPFTDRGHDALLSALYVNDGELHARFHEMGRQQASIAFDWMGQPTTLTETDLRNQPLGRLGHKTTLDAWQIRTVKIE